MVFPSPCFPYKDRNFDREYGSEKTGSPEQGRMGGGGRAEGVSGLPKFADNMPVFRRALGGIDD